MNISTATTTSTENLFTTGQNPRKQAQKVTPHQIFAEHVFVFKLGDVSL